MTEEEKKIEQRLMPLRFWLFVTLSALLIITFVYYLPLRFLHHTGEEHMEDGHDDSPMGHMQGALFETSNVTRGLTVEMSTIPQTISTGREVTLNFNVLEKPYDVAITDLEEEHTKYMHVIGVRSDLNEFFHIHPETIGKGLWSIKYTFENPGTYKMWAEVKRNGQNYAFAQVPIEIAGSGRPENKISSPIRTVSVGNYYVTLNHEIPVHAGHMAALSFLIHDKDGNPVEVEDYIGAKMHLAVIEDSLTQFIHAHPADDEHTSYNLIREALAHSITLDPSINFEVDFPEPGLYKAFAQFRPSGADLAPDAYLLAEFWIQVGAEEPGTMPDMH